MMKKLITGEEIYCGDFGEFSIGVDIVKHCKEYLADYKYPRIIEFVEEIPKTGSGKIDWRSLQEKENLKAETNVE